MPNVLLHGPLWSVTMLRMPVISASTLAFRSANVMGGPEVRNGEAGIGLAERDGR